MPDSLPLSIGIDFGGTSVKIGVCAGTEVIFESDRIPTGRHPTAPEMIGAWIEEVEKLRSSFGNVAAIGVGLPGFVNHETGVVHELTNVPGWDEVPLVSLLSEAIKLPVMAENDANCMAYAEYRHGAGKPFSHMIGITLGTGVGGGVVVDGKLFRGSRSGAGEIGQMSIDFAGRPGPHGARGALEEYIGNNEIAARAKLLYSESGRDLTVEACEPKALASAANEGDPVALQVWEEVSTHLACGLANVIWLINPDGIVVGGGIAEAGELLFKPLTEKIHAQLDETFKKHLQIVPAKFGNLAGIIGSAALALDSGK